MQVTRARCAALYGAAALPLAVAEANGERTAPRTVLADSLRCADGDVGPALAPRLAGGGAEGFGGPSKKAEKARKSAFSPSAGDCACVPSARPAESDAADPDALHADRGGKGRSSRGGVSKPSKATLSLSGPCRRARAPTLSLPLSPPAQANLGQSRAARLTSECRGAACRQRLWQ